MVFAFETTLQPGVQFVSASIAPAVIGQNLSWDFHTRQGVHLLRRPRKINRNADSPNLKEELRVWQPIGF